MHRETLLEKKTRLARIIRCLARAYPEAHCELEHANALELLIATILSAQCTDKRVNEVTRSLFREYSSAAQYASAPAAKLEKQIQSAGFFRNKTRSIQSCCRALVERH